MSAIQLLESIANNSELKSQILAGEVNQQLSNQIQESVDELGNMPMYCVFLPAEDDAPSESEEDDSEEKKEESIKKH